MEIAENTAALSVNASLAEEKKISACLLCICVFKDSNMVSQFLISYQQNLLCTSITGEVQKV